MPCRKFEFQLIGLFVLLLSCANLHAQVGQLILLKDGTILKGDVIEKDEYKVKFVTMSDDTLEYSYKYVQSVLADTPENKTSLQKEYASTKAHKIQGTFLSLDISAIPVSVSVGRRVTPSFNLGVQVMVNVIDYNPSWTLLLGVGPYGRYFFSKDHDRPKIFTDFTLGIAYREGSFISYVPYSSLALGVHLPSRGSVGLYFKAGGFMVQNFRRFSGVNGTEREGYLNIRPHITLLGIEF